MTVTDDLYCTVVAHDAAEACKTWLQTGRDHQWAAATSSTSLIVPGVLLLVAVVALWIAARAMRSTRPARTNTASDDVRSHDRLVISADPGNPRSVDTAAAAVGDAPATPGTGTAPGPPRYERMATGAYRLTEAHSTTGPA